VVAVDDDEGWFDEWFDEWFDDDDDFVGCVCDFFVSVAFRLLA